jgi:hypothetical protein
MPDEATQLVRDRRSLTELPAIGPYLEKVIRRWIEEPPLVSSPPEIRRGFLTSIKSRDVITRKPAWLHELKGDLQMHTNWSDGSGSITEMAETASERGYEYFAITDHSQGLKIARGINETELRQQAVEINSVNDALRRKGHTVGVPSHGT